jgi:hypothetical protein
VNGEGRGGNPGHRPVVDPSTTDSRRVARGVTGLKACVDCGQPGGMLVRRDDGSTYRQCDRCYIAAARFSTVAPRTREASGGEDRPAVLNRWDPAPSDSRGDAVAGRATPARNRPRQGSLRYSLRSVPREPSATLDPGTGPGSKNAVGQAAPDRPRRIPTGDGKTTPDLQRRAVSTRSATPIAESARTARWGR